ncbi:hypothetical protein ERO13_D01G183800v2 [Gossypium hirsutum]|nr:hypothetical protein ERO13_D01G183800v2 [Gossypium hirsutum]KAG4163633.1 hypothetical protein ERO13_D01G183800v2 [Gossypium hirsutum]
MNSCLFCWTAPILYESVASIGLKPFSTQEKAEAPIGFFLAREVRTNQELNFGLVCYALLIYIFVFV